MSSTGSSKHSTSANSRDHNQGRQDRNHTPAQLAAVNRVRKCKITDYYAILDIESPSGETEIRKAYRKLALIMHPDKNGAPGADEAFKMVSKAFQVLSDPDKKRIFDQTGADPEGGPGGAGASPFSNFSNAGMRGAGGMPNYGFSGTDAEDLFNMFFGGGQGFGGQGFGSGFGGPGFSFGPGVRVHTFGNGRGGVFGGGPGGPGSGTTRGASTGSEDFLHSIIQIAPLLLLFFLPLVFSLFGDSGSYNTNLPKFQYQQEDPFVQQRTSYPHNIPYFVNPEDKRVSELSGGDLRALDRRADLQYIRDMKNKCNREMDYKQRMMNEAQGWLFMDWDAYEEASNIPMESCDALDRIGVVYR